MRKERENRSKDKSLLSVVGIEWKSEKVSRKRCIEGLSVRRLVFFAIFLLRLLVRSNPLEPRSRSFGFLPS